LERAVETADVIANEMRLRFEVSANLNEIDYGGWTGKTFDSLAADPAWQSFNSSRADAAIPGGESITNVQRRMIYLLGRLSKDHDGGNVVLVSHAEPIRIVLRYCLGATEYMHDRLEISPASLSAIRLSPQPTVVSINHVEPLSRLLEE
jgi:probable phosphoglycerate mutase